MKLERITLENFRQYFSKQRLEFARDRQHNVTVIEGVNGAGKTSLFLAINWCLYGTSFENVRVIENVGELASKEATSRAEVGDLVRTAVELTFFHNGGRYLVRRALQGIKQQTGTVNWYEGDEFTVMRTRPDGQAEPVSNPLGVMNSILPVNVREYFLFDGEKIDNFAKPESADQVKQAIYLVLKLEILERSRRHLDALASEYRKDLKKVSGQKLRDLLSEEEKTRTEREKAGRRTAELEQEIISARRKVTEIDQALQEKPNAKALQQQRAHVEADLKQRRSELESTISQIRDLATGAYFVLGQFAIDRALAILNEKRERGEIPSSIRQQFVQDLLDQMRCICGRPFEHDSPEYQHLLDLLHNSLPGSLEDNILDTYSTLQGFDLRDSQVREDLDAAMKQRIQLVDFIRHLEEEDDDICRQLKGSPLEEISALEERRQTFLADIDSYNIEIGALKGRVEDRNRRLKELEKAIAKAQKEERKGQLLSAKLDLAQRTADAIGEIYQVFADDMRQRIETKTKEIFKQLVWKESHFQDIQLGSDFNLEVIDRYGLPARPELSAGERQVLSLSFIAAMSRISEEEAPLVMDTPFGRLSSQHRNSITQYLPNLADQLILFVTDEELRDQARINLESHIGAEYRLEFNPQTSCTEIIEVR
ncbi:MAG: chromosome segregation protein [Chloroflexi bacterium ADurb.Bin360]|nr:MAG: chromosome segregation protein [Chloroflexi bacterium ADurb.Bin360]